jgi:hypothetical protein
MKVLISCLIITFCQSSYSNILLKDIGVIGLASHDLFSWDRKREENTENGRLDLSTIFDYENGKRWTKGGNPKNGENAPVWSITKRLVKYYKNQRRLTGNNDLSRKRTVIKFHEMVEESFKRLSGFDFPLIGIDAKVTNEEQAVLRAFHDILPGRILIYKLGLPPIGISLTNFIFAKLYLSEKELNQEIPTFDGDYDEEYKKIKIPFAGITINLKEVDAKFIEKFSPYRQDEMLEELALVGRGELAIQDVSFIHHIVTLFRKGICGNSNDWINSERPCF